MTPGWRLRVSVAVFLVAVVIRLAFGLGYWNDKPLTRDEQEYLALAASLAGGHGFTYDRADQFPVGDRFSRAPGYPAFIAAVMWPDDDFRVGRAPTSVPIALEVVQAAVGAVGVLLIGVLTRRAAGPRAGVVAAWLAAFHPALVWISAYALSEALFSTVALLGALALSALDSDREVTPIWRTAAAGALAGLGALIRPAALPFVAVGAVWLVLRRRWMHAAVLVLAASTVLAPWTTRNLSVHGRFVLVAAGGGVTFWTGNHPAAVGEGDLAANPQLKAFNQAFREQHSGLTAEALEPHYYAESWRYIRAHPLDWLALEGRKLFYLFVPVGPSYLLHSPLYYWASVLPWLLLLPLAIAGYVQMVRLRRVPRALLAHVLATIAVCVIFFPQERFRIPILDPAAIVGAAAFLASRPWPWSVDTGMTVG